MIYYIAYNENLQVIGYGYTPNCSSESVSGILPLGMEETFDDFDSYKNRLNELGFEAIDYTVQETVISDNTIIYD